MMFLLTFLLTCFLISLVCGVGLAFGFVGYVRRRHKEIEAEIERANEKIRREIEQFEIKEAR